MNIVLKQDNLPSNMALVTAKLVVVLDLFAVCFNLIALLFFFLGVGRREREGGGGGGRIL